MEANKWDMVDSYDKAWIKRAEFALNLLPDDIHKIFEFGCGPYLGISKLLDSGFYYQGSDRISWTKEAISIDLEDRDWEKNGVFANKDFDVAVLLGVLEYVSDAPAFIRKAGSLFPNLLLSYCTKNDGAIIDERRNNGWVNDFSLIEVIEFLGSNSWIIKTATLYEDFHNFRQYVFFVSKEGKNG
jgi:hypothetical protein